MRTDNSIPKNQEETLKYIDGATDQADQNRLEGLQDAQNTQQVKDEVLQREQRRLEMKHGADHPEVVEAGNRITYNKQMQAGLDNEIEKASIKTEPFDRSTWRLQGRVFDNAGNAVKGVTVFLADSNKRWIEATGNSCTNESGYYSITVSEKILDGVIKDQPLYPSVSDKNKKILYMATEPLMAQKGSISYFDIYLKTDDCVTPPTPIIRTNKDQ